MVSCSRHELVAIVMYVGRDIEGRCDGSCACRRGRTGDVERSGWSISSKESSGLQRAHQRRENARATGSNKPDSNHSWWTPGGTGGHESWDCSGCRVGEGTLSLLGCGAAPMAGWELDRLGGSSTDWVCIPSPLGSLSDWLWLPAHGPDSNGNGDARHWRWKECRGVAEDRGTTHSKLTALLGTHS